METSRSRTLSTMAIGALGGAAAFLLGLTIVACSALIVPASAAAPSAPELEDREQLISSFAEDAGYEDLSPEAQQTWTVAADVLYGELGAYDVPFELTDDPAKNCAVKIHGRQGGCYHPGGTYAGMIFLSPGLTEEQASFIAYHEYAHHLQRLQGGEGTRFVANRECDADLRALELRGSWVEGFEHQCLAIGMVKSQLTLDNLPNLERTHALRG